MIMDDFSTSFVSVEKLQDFEDEYRGKQFIYKDPTMLGQRETAEFTIRQGNAYYVLFKSGIKMSVSEVSQTMTEALDYKNVDDDLLEAIPRVVPEQILAPEELPYLQEQMNKMGNFGRNQQQVQQVQPVKQESPVTLLLKKSKMVEQEIPIILKSLPKPTYDILSESFEGFLDELVEYMVNGEDLKVSIKESL